MNKRMDRTRLNIGTYFLDPKWSDAAHVADMKNCGIDFVVCMHNTPAALDLLQEHGIGAVVSGVLPGWWGGDGSNAGKMREMNPIEKYSQAAEQFKDHPAIWGIDTGDEPSALDFPYYGEVISLVEKKFENQFAYLNLYPNYASVSKNNARETVNQLGTPTYAEHIAKYVENVPTDYICYDFYLYSVGQKFPSRALENLRIVSDACAATGRSMWIVLQVNSNDPAKWITENQLRFQAYSALAFGAENIIWACWNKGWWENQVLDDNGEKTQQYKKLRKINRELHLFGEEYMRYARVATHLVGFPEERDLQGLDMLPELAVNNAVFTNVRGQDGGKMIVTEMTARDGSGKQALLVVNAEDPMNVNDSARNLIFRADGKNVRAFSGRWEVRLRKMPDGSYQVPVVTNEGILLIAE